MSVKEALHNIVSITHGNRVEIEFIADQQFGMHTQPSLSDTLLDLLMGLSGGIVVIATMRPRPS